MTQNKKISFFSILVGVMVIGLLMFFSLNSESANSSGSTAMKTQLDLGRRAGIDASVFELALKAHTKAYQKGLTQSKILTIIDYSKPSTQKRFWVIDLQHEKVVFHTYVAHGSGSGDKYARAFSNQPGSYKTSIGAFVTGGTYTGRHGTSLNLIGLEPGINHNAYSRRIVIHAANYVSEQFVKQHGRLGRSWGCPALDRRLARPVIDTIKEGVFVFAYFPEPYWLKHSSFVGANII